MDPFQIERILFLKGGRKKGGETLKENRSYMCVCVCVCVCFDK